MLKSTFWGAWRVKEEVEADGLTATVLFIAVSEWDLLVVVHVLVGLSPVCLLNLYLVLAGFLGGACQCCSPPPRGGRSPCWF
ncbi:hypothetical protein GUJ93_ZPchr0013g35383 [Zizania palustris]|uniref:Uncharacterized protein n=1 Tax=Zizania palustris TaxID=103762 RepID=A0A8J6BTH9_ZIZPA|nr:hypothetical protein GUJ93_ZPchr0013g35383 [Zizania palustris]